MRSLKILMAPLHCLTASIRFFKVASKHQSVCGSFVCSCLDTRSQTATSRTIAYIPTADSMIAFNIVLRTMIISCRLPIALFPEHQCVECIMSSFHSCDNLRNFKICVLSLEECCCRFFWRWFWVVLVNSKFLMSMDISLYSVHHYSKFVFCMYMSSAWCGCNNHK